MSKVIKDMELEDLRRTFKEVRDLVVLSVERLDSQGDYQLRKNLRDKQIRLKVVKNSLTRKVFKELNFTIPDNSEYWSRPTTLAWGKGSISQVSKDIDSELKNPKNLAKYKETVKVKGAIADGQVISFDLAKSMPTREDLIAQI
ncbi:MAG: 50S ribosomal protein L10, partial [Gemmataceae bacterium]